MVNQVLETEVDSCSTFIVGVNTTPTPNSVAEASITKPAAVHQISGWHMKLTIHDQYLNRCIDRGAQVICYAQVSLKVVIWDAVKARQRTCWRRRCPFENCWILPNSY